MRVGYESRNYGGARNTYTDLPGIERVKVRRVPFEMSERARLAGLTGSFVPLGPSNVELVHLWNRVSTGRRPWAVSFEFDLPYIDGRRNPQLHRRLRKRLLSDSCRFIAPISDHAYRVFSSTIAESEIRDLAHKIEVVLPEQPPMHRTVPFQPPTGSQPLRLLFVGKTFFGKGGEAVLRAVERLGEELDLWLTVISPVQPLDYEHTPPSSVDVDSVRERLSDNPRIRWTTGLARSEVLEEMQNAHVGLLPTFADTFGYVVLEYMALGVPTIVSNVQALPEFTGPDTGWSVDVDVDDVGIWVGRRTGRETRSRAYTEGVDQTAQQIETLLRHIRASPNELARVSPSATARAREQFDVSRRNDQLASLYQKAVS